MTFLLLVVFLLWVVPLVAVLLVAMATGVSPSARAYVFHHLFGPDQARAPSEKGW